MATEKQRNAARINGAKSKGPVTARGKANSSRNRLSHGLLAQTVVLDDESRLRFEALRGSLFEALLPGSPLEELLVEKMVVAQWRQNRAWAMEKAGYHMPGAPEDPEASSSEYPLIRDTAAFRGQAPHTALLQRYETSCDRQFLRNLREYRLIQAARISKSENSAPNPATDCKQRIDPPK